MSSSSKVPLVGTGSPQVVVKTRNDLIGAGIGLVGVFGLFISLFVQYSSLQKGGDSGTNDISSYVKNLMAYVVPTLILAILGWNLFAYYNSSVNKSQILWYMAITAIIFSNIALVASLFQVRVVTQYT
jgi:hypothetical protein